MKVVNCKKYSKHGEENQYTPKTLPQRAAGRCEAVEVRTWNSFRSGFAEIKVGEDGKSPIQLADLLGSHEAACAVN